MLHYTYCMHMLFTGAISHGVGVVYWVELQATQDLLVNTAGRLSMSCKESNRPNNKNESLYDAL